MRKSAPLVLCALLIAGGAQAVDCPPVPLAGMPRVIYVPPPPIDGSPIRPATTPEEIAQYKAHIRRKQAELDQAELGRQWLLQRLRQMCWAPPPSRTLVVYPPPAVTSLDPPTRGRPFDSETRAVSVNAPAGVFWVALSGVLLVRFVRR